MVPSLSSFGPAWLTGVPSSSRLRRAFAMLLAHWSPPMDGAPVAPGFPNLPAGPFAGWVLELGRAPSNEAFATLLERLAGALPDGSELAFVAHTHPAVAGLDAWPDAAQGLPTQDPVLAARRTRLLGAARPTAVRCSTYLFVRTDPRALDASRASAFVALRSMGWPAREAAAGDLCSALRAWSPLRRLEAVEARSAWVARPVARAQHAAQWRAVTDERLLDTARWSCLQLRLRRDTPDARARFDAVLVELLQGAASEMPELRERLQRELREASFEAREVGLREGHAAALPWLLGAARLWRLPALRHSVPVSLSRAAALVPFDAGLPLPRLRTESRSAAGALRVRNARGESVLLDTRSPGLAAHVLVQGSAGAGNTYAAHAVLASHLAAGGHAWAIRWASEPIFDALHGLTGRALTPAAPFSLNPLAGYASLDALRDDAALLLGWLDALAGQETRPLEAVAAELVPHLLEHALCAAWALHGAELTVHHVCQALDAHEHPAASPLAERLRKRLCGLDERWLRGRSPLLDERGSCSFDTQELSGSVWGELLCTTLLVLHARVAFELDRRRSKVMALDELALIGSTGASKLLEVLLRRARPYDVQWVCVTGTFSADTARQRPHERVLSEHCPYRLLLAGPLEDQRGWVLRVANEAREEALLRQVRTHAGHRARAVWVDEARSGAELVTLELSAHAHPVFGHDREVLLAWKKARREGLEPWAAYERALREVPRKGARR